MRGSLWAGLSLKPRLCYYESIVSEDEVEVVKSKLQACHFGTMSFFHKKRASTKANAANVHMTEVSYGAVCVELVSIKLRPRVSAA